MLDVVLTVAVVLAVVLGLLSLKSRRVIVRLDEDNQRLCQEKQMVLDFMHDMVEALGEGLSKDELYQRIVHAAVLSSGALSACVFELTPEGTLRGVAVEGLFPPQRPIPERTRVKLTTRAKFIEQILRSEVLGAGEGIIGAAAQSGEVILVEDGENDERIVKHDDSSLTVKSMIAAPILFRKQTIGVLAVANASDGLSFNQTDVSLIKTLAEQAGLAIHNSFLLNLQLEKRKLDVDLALASNIQQMLLPRTFPQVQSLDIDAYYVPAQKVGGDLYDFFHFDDGRVGVAVADVSGKGIPASLLMTICRTNLRHFSRLYDSPSRVLSELNRSMTPEMRGDMFITLVYAVIDPRAGDITYCRCGHERPLHGHNDARTGIFVTDMLASEGMAVGMVSDELFDTVLEDKRIPFNPGDVFVLYTDGVTEACNEDGIEFSSGRLADVVKTLRNRSARELNQGIIEAVDRFVGRLSSHSDDITLVAVRRT